MSEDPDTAEQEAAETEAAEQAAAESAEPAIVGTVALTQKDVERGIVEMSALFRARRIVVGAVALLIVAVLVLKPQVSSWTALAPQLVCVLVFLAVLFVSPRRAAGRILTALTSAGDSNVTYRFDAEGFTIRASGSTSSSAYRTLSRAAEGANTFLLYINPVVANIIPKRAFSDGDLVRIRGYLAPHLAAKSGKSAGTRKVLVLWAVLILAFVFIWQFLSSPSH